MTNTANIEYLENGTARITLASENSSFIQLAVSYIKKFDKTAKYNAAAKTWTMDKQAARYLTTNISKDFQIIEAAPEAIQPKTEAAKTIAETSIDENRENRSARQMAEAGFSTGYSVLDKMYGFDGENF